MLFHKLADVFFFIDADVTAEQIANPAITQRRQLTYQRLVHSIDSALDKNNYDALQLPRKKHIICSKAVDKQNKIEYNLKFSNQPPPPEGRQASQDILKNKPGVKGSAKNVKTPKDAFDLFFTDKICKKIVFYTNKHIEKTLSNLPPDTDYSKCPYLKEIDTEDLHATIGLMYFRGLFNQNNKNCRLLFGDKYGQPVFSATMSRNRFLFIVANLRFDDEETRPNRWKKDRFTALREIFEDCNNNFAKHLVPEDFISLDETLYPMRTQVAFKMYNPDKPAKYGILFKSLNYARYPYTYYSHVYSGKPESTDSEYYFVGTNNYVKYLVEGLEKHHSLKGRNISMDRLYTGIILTKWLLMKDITMLGTMMSNRVGLPAEIKDVKHRDDKSTEVYWEHEHKINLSSYVVQKKIRKEKRTCSVYNATFAWNNKR